METRLKIRRAGEQVGEGGRETKLGSHSCRSDLPADNCVAFPQMASGDERHGRIVNRPVGKNARCIISCDTRERNTV